VVALSVFFVCCSGGLSPRGARRRVAQMKEKEGVFPGEKDARETLFFDGWERPKAAIVRFFFFRCDHHHHLLRARETTTTFDDARVV